MDLNVKSVFVSIQKYVARAICRKIPGLPWSQICSAPPKERFATGPLTRYHYGLDRGNRDRVPWKECYIWLQCFQGRSAAFDTEFGRRTRTKRHSCQQHRTRIFSNEDGKWINGVDWRYTKAG